MPWAAWAIGALLAAFWLPSVGGWISHAFIIVTLAPIGLVMALFQVSTEGTSGAVEMTMAMNNVVSPGGPRGSLLAGLSEHWAALVIWFVVLAVLGFLIVGRMRARREARIPLNAFILIAGWPLCYWIAIQAFVHSH